MDKKYYLKKKGEIIKNIMGETEYIANLIVFFAMDKYSYVPMKKEILKKEKIN